MLSSERYSANIMNMIYDNLYLGLYQEVGFEINSEVSKQGIEIQNSEAWPSLYFAFFFGGGRL